MKKRYLKWNKPKREVSFKTGQQVQITGNPCCHGFKIGQVVTITRAIFNGDWWDLSAANQGTTAKYFHEECCKHYVGGKK